jgi:hypothetical protein
VSFVSKKRQEEILTKLCALREQKGKVFSNGGPPEVKMIEAQEVDREIALLEFELKDRHKKGKNGAYCIAKIKLSEGGKDPKELKVVIKDHCILSSFETSEHIISKDCLLACAIMKTPIGAIGLYKTRSSEMSVLVLEKRIL